MAEVETDLASRPETVFVEFSVKVTAPASEPAVPVEAVKTRLPEVPAASSDSVLTESPVTAVAVAVRLS